MDYVSNADSDNSPSVLTSPPAEGGKYPSLSASMMKAKRAKTGGTKIDRKVFDLPVLQ